MISFERKYMHEGTVSGTFRSAVYVPASLAWCLRNYDKLCCTDFTVHTAELDRNASLIG